MAIAPELREAAKVSKAWPYEEARKLLKRYPDGPPTLSDTPSTSSTFSPITAEAAMIAVG